MVRLSRYYCYEQFCGTKFSETPEEVIDGCGSSYHPTAPLLNIMEALNREQNFAFMGKPCDINALRNLGKTDPRVDKYCKCMVNMVCGSFADPSFLDRFLAGNGIKDPDDIEDFRWRGHGCPGDGTPFVKTKAGKVARMDYVDYWYQNGGEHGPLTYQWRCKMCPDFWGYESDITVMDCWPDNLPEHGDRVTEARRHERDGWAVILARTERGVGCLDAALRGGLFIQDPAEDLDVDALVPLQGHLVRKSVGLLAKRQANAVVQPALSANATERMLKMALDRDVVGLATAVGDQGVSMSWGGGGLRKGTVGSFRETLGGGGEELREAFDALPDEQRAFHEKNYAGTKSRLARGDAEEPFFVLDGV